MEKTTRRKLVEIAREQAQIPFRGYIEGKKTDGKSVCHFTEICLHVSLFP